MEAEAARAAALEQRRKREALREFHEFSKKMKMDTGLTIKTLAGGDIVELDELLSDSDEDEDEDEDSSDGFSEREFTVDPEAALQPHVDESHIDPETGDFRPPSIADLLQLEPAPGPSEPQAEDDVDYNITEKLKEMGEISVKPVKTEDPPPEEEPDTSAPEKTEDGESKPPEDDEDKSVNSAAVNVRRNIREVMDENQLDASTLAAQRQELERLARVQEQQRIIREVRRQIALGRQDRTQARVLSLLQGRSGSSVLKKPMGMDPSNISGLNLPGTVLMKLPPGDPRKLPKPSHQEIMKMQRAKLGNLTPSVSIAPVGALIKQELPKPGAAPRKDVVEIVDSSSTSSSSDSGPSSDSDDCIMLSDSELPPSPEPEEDPQNSGLHVNDNYNIPDDQGRVVINIGHPENEEDIFLAPQIGRIIKPHQIGGVRFLFDNIIESVERFSTSTGFGCILAHSMGLGKTLQIVCFCDIFLRHTQSKTVLCIMPINTLQNWVAEFNMWLPLDASTSPLNSTGEVRSRHFPIYVLNDSHKTLQARAKVIKEWHDVGGVLMIGYELYRLLSLKKNKKPRNRKKKNDTPVTPVKANDSKLDILKDTMDSEKLNDMSKLHMSDKMPDMSDHNNLMHPNITNLMNDYKHRDSLLDMNGDKHKDIDLKDPIIEKKDDDDDSDEEKKLLEEIYNALVKPGPDLVICDEGHRIKNSHSNISFALKQMRTKRRIVLTGYPLQNNLLEYWCMVDFVRPNYLGTKTEFSNMFERPIQNGQCIDSTPQDIRLMRYRAHVLHSLLVGFVQRRSHAVLQSSLPQKEEYVMLVRMTDLQRTLYDIFMNEVVRKNTVPNPLKAFAVCCKIWNHPDVLYYFLKKRNEMAAILDYDLEIEDNPNLVPGNPNNLTPIEDKKTKKGRTPKKREKKPPKNSKPAATIPPNTSNLPNTSTNYDNNIKLENSNGAHPYNNPPAYPSTDVVNKAPFESPIPIPKDTNNFPPYQQAQQGYTQGNYYPQNQSYPAAPYNNTNYYSNQSYGYNNYNSQNPQLPQLPQIPAENSAPNTNFNQQNYWGTDNNYYNNSNSNYYSQPQQPPQQQQQQQQQPQQLPQQQQQQQQQQPAQQQQQSNYPTNNDPYNSMYDPYNQPQPNFSFNENRTYDNKVQNGEQNRTNFTETSYPNNTSYQQPNTVAVEQPIPFEPAPPVPAIAQTNNFNNSLFSSFQNIEDPAIDDKSSLHDEISTLCWPVGSENIKSELPLHNALLDIKKEEKNADSDGEIKIADLDTMKVIVDEKPIIKQEEIKIEPKVEAEAIKTEECKVENKFIPSKTEEISNMKPEKEEEVAKVKTPPKRARAERKPRERKPREKKERKPRATKDSKDKGKNKDRAKGDNVLSDIETDIEGEKEDKKSEKYEEVSYDWATDMLKTYVPGIIENSAKMEIFFCILEESIRLGDRILLFSQSLFTLNLIEDFLQKNLIPGTDINWGKNRSYYRLDGSTSALEREKLINEFNSNPNIHLFLVSTRAGSLGINLVGANRVVVFDASWNPCHDTQAVCRVYRYGQKKPCFVYRLVMDFCLEKKIYDRQINKQGMADRVVDECNPDAVLSMKEVTNLCWDSNEKEEEVKEFEKDCKDKYIDVVMRKIIVEHASTLSKEPFQHESLLVDRKEKKLSSAEKRLAQRGYELEKKAASNTKPSLLYRTIRTADGTLIQRPVASVRPMQHSGSGSGGTRWIPADVWQRQGMTAQEMTLPLDVVIPTSSAEKTNIVLKAGQKVMVLKSPKGIYMQLESGKIIAIKTSFKVGQPKNMEMKEGPKKVLPSRPQNVNLPGSLKNNSAITVISKNARGGMSKMLNRPPVMQKKIGTSIRPMIPGPRILDPKIRPVQSNLHVRPYSLIRGRNPQPRGSRPIPIQNNLNIKIQGPLVRPPFNANPEMGFSDEMESMEQNHQPEYGQYSEDGSISKLESEHSDNSTKNDFADNSNSYDAENTSAPPHLDMPEGGASEDSSQEKTYADLSDRGESKITTKILNKKSPLPLQKHSIGNIFKDCNIQIKNNNPIPPLPLELGFVNDVTIKRTSSASSSSTLGSMPGSAGSKEKIHPAPIHILSEEACHTEGMPADYLLPPLQNSDLSDDSYAESNVTMKEKKIYKPNLIDRKTKINSLKNYRHPKMMGKPIPIHSPNYAMGEVSPASTSSTPTPPPMYSSGNQSSSSSKMSHEKFESSLSQLEKTTSLISRSPKKGGMSDFQQSLSDITQTYSPNPDMNPGEALAYKPGPKSRKKKNPPPSQPESKMIEDYGLSVGKLKNMPNSIATSDHSPAPSIIPNAPLPNIPTGNFSHPAFNNAPEMPSHPGFPEANYQQQVPPVPESVLPQPYNSYPGYPSTGGSYPPYPTPPYYQHYPPGTYPAYPQYPAPPGYPPAPYPPSPYPGYPYPNPNQW